MRLSWKKARELGITTDGPGKRPKLPKADPTFERTAFLARCATDDLPEPVPEFEFCPGRRWRFDWAWPALKVALEIDGFAPEGEPGRHQRTAGFLRDQEKHNEACIRGWRVLRCRPRDVRSGAVFALLKRALGEMAS